MSSEVMFSAALTVGV